MQQTIRNHPNTKSFGILDKQFQYTPAVKTDIMARFRAMGWTPPSEQKGKTNDPSF